MRLLDVVNLTVSFVQHEGVVQAVRGMTLHLDAGESLGIVGESGSGKSVTCMAALRLLREPPAKIAADRLELGGVDVLTARGRDLAALRGRVAAMIFQDPMTAFDPSFTIGHQIVETIQAHRATPKAQARAEAEALLRRVEIKNPGGVLDAYPHQLSGGMLQRAMIAMALSCQPQVLFADEPTTALDVTIQAQILQLIKELQAEMGMGLIMVTHDLGVVAETAHRIGVMYAGQIVEQASREDLFAQPLHPYTQKLFAALPHEGSRNRPLAAIPGSVPPLGSIGQGCRFAPRCDRVFAPCREEAPVWTTLADGQGVRCHIYAAGVAGRVKGEEGRVEGSLAGREKEEGRREKGEGKREKPRSGIVPSPFTLPSSLLQVSDLRVHFPIRKGILQRVAGQVKAVDGVSLSIEKGRTLALVGESGCGKTTLGKALLRLVPPTGGCVQFDGREMVGGRAQQRASMQMVFQDPYASLNPKMRVAEILEEGMSALNIGADSAARQAHIDELLDKVGLARDSKWRYPHEFSGGQRQRIAIARALAVSPRLLICDEPTSALDVSVQAQILNLLKSLQDEMGLSYLFITHNLAVVEYLAHEVCVMYLGRIVERGTTAEVMRAPLHPYTRALLSAVPRIDGAGVEYVRLEGELPSPAHPPAGCHFAPRCPQVMPVCTRRFPEMTHAGTSTHGVNCHLYPALPN